MIEARAYWVERCGEGSLRSARVDAEPAPGQSLLQAEWGAISVGTERLIGRGEVPADCTGRMECRYMEGDFELPIKYGYCIVGRVAVGTNAGRRAFVMHPHQDWITVADEHLLLLDEALPAQRATLTPNLETALNAVWDAELRGDERVLVVGGGAVGLLCAYVVWRLHGRAAVLVESDGRRRELARTLPWIDSAEPTGVEAGSFEVAFHTSATEAGLQLALDAVGFEGRVIELSWFGRREVTLALGSGFHYDRKRLIASQVAHVAGPKRATHDHAARLAEVQGLLDCVELDVLLAEVSVFDGLPAWMGSLYAGSAAPPVPTVRYPER